MKIDQLTEKNVRVESEENPAAVGRMVTLDDSTLAGVVGGGAGIDQSICEIHFYYPADGTA